jgi:hypothetical protein
MSDLWRWQCKGAGCRACFNAEGAIGGTTCPYCGNVGRRVMLIPDAEPGTHDHRDFGLQELKRDPGHDWEREQGREYFPGVGKL